MSSLKNVHFLILLVFSLSKIRSQECNKRYFGFNSFVCVCNEDSCDSFPPVSSPEPNFLTVITSSQDEFRFNVENVPMFGFNFTSHDVEVFLNLSDVRQTMLGFGGAFTDATGINVVSLSSPLQETLLSQYFSPDGLEYNVGRVPIAGCDFSTHPYSYDDVEGDVDLAYFNLTEEDYLYKLPLVRRAKELSERGIHLFASPWAPPSWMKTNGMFNGSGSLLPEMRQPWANYFVKFLNAYSEEGVEFWGLTPQNEPFVGSLDWPWNACHFTGEEQRDFIRDYLGPALNQSGYSGVKLIIADDSRYIFPEFPVTVLDDPEANVFISGVGVHWYSDEIVPVSVVTRVHNKHPDKFILYTEACAGTYPYKGEVELGQWTRGQQYATDIIENTNHWSVGWTDWNLALGMDGGPNWANNLVDSPIIVNEEENEFYKQPMFYVMGHFSKFIPEGSLSVSSHVNIPPSDNEVTPFSQDEGVDVSSFIDPNGKIVSVILNKFNNSMISQIEDTNGNRFTLNLPAKSVQTVLYNP